MWYFVSLKDRICSCPARLSSRFRLSDGNIFAQVVKDMFTHSEMELEVEALQILGKVREQ